MITSAPASGRVWSCPYDKNTKFLSEEFIILESDQKTGGIGNAQNGTIVSIAQNAGEKFYTKLSRQCQENIPYSK
jgi:hypothetical protein